MKKVLGIVMALMLVFAVAGAWADDIQGKIKSVDTGERSFVLEDGTQLWVAEGVAMDNLKEVGEGRLRGARRQEGRDRPRGVRVAPDRQGTGTPRDGVPVHHLARNSSRPEATRKRRIAGAGISVVSPATGTSSTRSFVSGIATFAVR